MCTRCIYCNSDENLTTSDIIPDSMTSAKFTNKNVCKTHNNLTNSAFENAFSNQFKFFRNQLGYVDRRFGTPVSFKADIYANDTLILKNCTIYSLRHFFETRIATDENGNYFVRNVKPEYTKMLNPNISYNVKIDWCGLFLSKITQKTIAKIAYEFHCFNNNIRKKENRYDAIIDFLLNDSNNNPVEVIDDAVFDEITKSAFNYIEGSHALLEYAEGGKRFVVCTLFGAVWYRVTICDDFLSSYNVKKMYLFLLDGSCEIHDNSAVGVACFDDGHIGELQNGLFFAPYSIKIETIGDVKVFLESRINVMTALLTGATITINQMKNYRTLLSKINLDDLNEIELKKSIMYQENAKLTALLCFYAFRTLPIKSFTERELLDYFDKNYSLLRIENPVDLILSKDFISGVKIGLDTFSKLLSAELITK